MSFRININYGSVTVLGIKQGPLRSVLSFVAQLVESLRQNLKDPGSNSRTVTDFMKEYNANHLFCKLWFRRNCLCILYRPTLEFGKANSLDLDPLMKNMSELVWRTEVDI